MKKILIIIFLLSTVAFSDMYGAKQHLRKQLYNDGTPLIKITSSKYVSRNGNTNIYEFKGEYRQLGKVKPFTAKIRDINIKGNNKYQIISY